MPLSTEVLRQRLAQQEWTDHNIHLNEEVTTIPGRHDFLQDGRLVALRRMLSVLYLGDLAGLRIADLACLEGGFALALAQQGASAIGIEARARNLEKALLLKEHFAIPNLEFVLGDVKEFTRETFGAFDIILALGILYHLDEPVGWLGQVAEATESVLILDTHYAPADDDSLALMETRIAQQLGPLETTDVGGLACEGRWYTEYKDGADVENLLWASYSNPSSFWLTKESLLLALLRAGFDLVLEERDWMAAQYRYYTTAFSRAMFVAIKSEAFIENRRTQLLSDRR